MLLRILRLAVFLLIPIGSASAQSGFWDPRFGPTPFTDGPVNDMLVSGDTLFVGGAFTRIEGVEAAGIAMLPASTGRWEPLGSGTSSAVLSLAMMGDTLFVGGAFTSAGSQPIAGLAAWDRTTGTWGPVLDPAVFRWDMFGEAAIYAVERVGDDIYLAGNFVFDRADSSRGVARWNRHTHTMTALGRGIGRTVLNIAAAGGDIFVVGDITVPPSRDIVQLARWNPASGAWSVPTVSGSRPMVKAIAGHFDDLIVAGWVSVPGGPAGNLARLNTTDDTWHLLDPSHPQMFDGGPVRTLTADGDHLLIGLDIGQAKPHVYDFRFSDRALRPVDAGFSLNGAVFSTVFFGSRVIAGGVLNRPDLAIPYVTAIDTSTGRGARVVEKAFLSPNATVRAMVADGDRGVYVGGDFTRVGDSVAAHIAHWNGERWDTLGAGLDGAVTSIVRRNDVLYAAGEFRRSGALPLGTIARWDERSGAWSALGPDRPDGAVTALALARNGDLFAAGDFRNIGSLRVNNIARWRDGAWRAIGRGTAGINGPVTALAMKGDTLFASGVFKDVGGPGLAFIARLDPVSETWSRVGATGIDQPATVLYATDEELVAGGYLSTADTTRVAQIASWDGSRWRSLAGGFRADTASVKAITAHGRYLVAGGSFTQAGDGTPMAGLAGFDYERWCAIPDGVRGQVLAMASIDGRLYVGGDFVVAGGVPTRFFGAWVGTAASVEERRSVDHGASVSIRPNPAAGTVVVECSLPAYGAVAIDVVDELGRVVRTHERPMAGPGTARFPIALDGLPVGSYSIRLRSGSYSATARLLVR